MYIFEVPGDSTAMLGMPDIQPLTVLKITCKVMGNTNDMSTFDLQTIEESNVPSYKRKQTKIRWVVNDANANMPEYFRSSGNRAADKRVSHVLTNKIHNEFSDVFQK